MASPSPPRDRRDFKIAIICALPLEAEAVLGIFDRSWKKEKKYGRLAEDHNAYTTGAIGEHNVVLVHMPNMGKVSASSVATGLRFSFPCIKLALVVGICGGVPYDTKTKKAILLGDVVMSREIIQYDLGKQHPSKFEVNKTTKDILPRPPQEIRAVLAKLETDYHLQEMQNSLQKFLGALQQSSSRAKYPGSESDILYEPSYLHKHHEQRIGFKCDQCAKSEKDICSDAPKLTCHQLGCEESKFVRSRLGDAQRSPPLVHFGAIGSADMVMRSGEDRDRIARTDFIAFEMEGAGVWDHFPSIVIKGVCDYADSHKTKRWQNYAAATAAACLKAFLEEWDSEDASNTPDTSPTPILYFPSKRQNEFVGRTSQLENLEKKLFQPSRHQRVAVVGLGGVGKSRVASELAQRTALQRPAFSVFWVNATDAPTFEKDYFEIGQKLQIQGIEDEKADIKLLVQQHLEHTGEWLMILDGADDESIWGKRTDQNADQKRLIQYLPDNPNASILITSRNHKLGVNIAGRDTIRLEKMTPDEAFKMLKELLVNPDILNASDAATGLLGSLAYLPLAIVQAAAYINENDISIQRYQKLLNDTEERVIALLSRDFGDGYGEIKNSVATTWLVSFEQIRHRNPLASDYLSFMSCLSSKNIPQSLLPSAPPDEDMVDAIGTLKAYSFLIEQNHQITLDSTYDMHQLVQLSTRNWLRKEKLLQLWTRKATQRVATLFPECNHEYRPIWISYMPHARYVCSSPLSQDLEDRYILLEKMGVCLVAEGKYIEAIDTHTAVVTWREASYKDMDQRTLRAYYCLGRALTSQGESSRAEVYNKKALEGLKAGMGAEHPDTLTSMANLASIYSHQGRWKEAEELQVQVIETRKRVLDVEHPYTLTSMANLVSTYFHQGRWKEAEELQVQVVEISVRVLGAEHPSTLTNIANLASTYNHQGRWKEAEELELQAIEIRKRVLGAEHPDTLTSIGNLASTYSNQGRWKEAEELEVQVMEIRKRVLGAEHPSTLTSIGNLASIYSNQGRWKEAEELEVQVMEIRKRVLGAEHPSTLTSIANLASTYTHQGRWKEAEELQVQVMEIRKRVLGAEHPSTLTSIGNLASTYSHQGRWKEAEELELQVMEINVKVLGAEHPNTLASIGNLASTYSHQGRWKEAEELELQVMEINVKVLGAEHPNTLANTANLASIYSHQGRWKEAEELELQVMETRKRVLGAEHPDTLTSMGNLASTYFHQGRWKEAEELEVQVMEIRKRVLGTEHPDTLTSMGNLASTYSHQGRWKEAEKLFGQVMEM